MTQTIMLNAVPRPGSLYTFTKPPWLLTIL